MSLVFYRGLIQTGTTWTPPNALKIIDFASITGKPAIGPMFPKPRTAVPSVTIAFRVWQVHFGCVSITFRIF